MSLDTLQARHKVVAYAFDRPVDIEVVFRAAFSPFVQRKTAFRADVCRTEENIPAGRRIPRDYPARAMSRGKAVWRRWTAVLMKAKPLSLTR